MRERDSGLWAHCSAGSDSHLGKLKWECEGETEVSPSLAFSSRRDLI